MKKSKELELAIHSFEKEGKVKTMEEFRKWLETEIKVIDRETGEEKLEKPRVFFPNSRLYYRGDNPSNIIVHGENDYPTDINGEISDDELDNLPF